MTRSTARRSDVRYERHRAQPAPDFAAKVWSWWSTARASRDVLPWRSLRDPWLVLVSEVMLAQTQASRVAERFPHLVDRFPTPQVCAAAGPAEVVRLWVGLGYNRRAVALHRTAATIVDRHGGMVPATLDDLVALPGVGPYTARAVLAFAFGDHVGVVDTNIARVLARAVAGEPLTRRGAQELADHLTPRRRSRDWNLALMDLGNLVCGSRAPRCEVCPLAASACAWRNGPDRADPAVGTAHASKRQAAFAGSDREGRGRLVRAACENPIPRSELAELAGWPDDAARAAKVAAALVRDGVLAEAANGDLVLA